MIVAAVHNRVIPYNLSQYGGMTIALRDLLGHGFTSNSLPSKPRNDRWRDCYCLDYDYRIREDGDVDIEYRREEIFLV